MKLDMNPGKYVVAVSGGVDSMVLLEMLSKQPDLNIRVAHFDHGIREDSRKDTDFVRKESDRYSMPIETSRGNLGTKVSEADARKARYDFLEKIQKKYKAGAIITAHHQDDLIETAILNLLRGTGWRGMVAITRNQNVHRPLLGFSKKEIVDYAKKNKISWREDPTNLNRDYLRNRIRHEVIPKLSTHQRKEILKIIENLASSAPKLDRELTKLSAQAGRLDRKTFAQLPSKVADELMLVWLKNSGVEDIDRQAISRLVNAVKVGRPGTSHEVKSGVKLKLTATFAELSPAKRPD